MPLSQRDLKTSSPCPLQLDTIKSGSRRLGATSIRQPAQIGAFCLLGGMTYDSSPCLLQLDTIKSGSRRLGVTSIRRGGQVDALYPLRQRGL
ncbi:hypothetical protein [Jeotgalibacillus proteolyticus]|uniref:hypothetical protein n=1 Tax=Jeotgalibacillus proteolyticus TaxID=2082395 RepID=UPI001073DD00|nr:hypothetical protein [Jeotgalibacillus proteolyticus]